MKRTIIIGGGFGGINFAKGLSGSKDYDMTLIDLNNYSFFPPLLYQVSSAFIEPANIIFPFRRMFHRCKNLHFFMGELLNVKPESNLVETTNGTLAYDLLILALGTEANYYGLENVKSNALPMKTVDDSIRLRNHILQDLEAMGNDIVISGGGPSGVELAGMLAEMKRKLLFKDYPDLKSRIAEIYLVDAGSKLLATMSTKASAYALRSLTKLGVKVLLNTRVQDYKDKEVVLSNGNKIQTTTMVWASGVIAKGIPGIPSSVLTRGRRIMVDEFNRVEGFSNIYAIGDICLQSGDSQYPDGHPQLAQVAIQQGRCLAENLSRSARNQPQRAFSYFNKGNLAVISRYKAVADLPGISFCGFFAWLTWLFAHIVPIAAFRNKINLLIAWGWNFISNGPILRLIVRPDMKFSDDR